MLPHLPLLLMRAAAPRDDWPWILAELEAEYTAYTLPARGPKAARRWLWSQALRSIGSLAVRRLENHEWQYALFAIVLASAGPVLFMEASWSYLLSLIPYKADLARGADFVKLCLSLYGASGFFAGLLCTPRGMLAAVPIAWGFVWLALLASHSITPSWFGIAILGILTLGLAAGAGLRRFVERPRGGRFA